ncbi:bmrU domain protein [[Clostridium] sordellii ATCC 9714]|nr:bmrU domain protein [[Clostridium] sordellii ATCC 9714] [Paeniclostridium sordellii ATCC 9714]
MKKIKFIYNPNSGDKKIVYKLDNIISKFQNNGYTVVPYRLSKESNIKMG